eukprot:842205-Alexandrium_andersonii.AAC.1
MAPELRRARAWMRQMPTPMAPRNWAPPRRSECPPQRSAPEAVEIGRARSPATATIVAAAAALETTAPEVVGKSGVAGDAGSKAHANSTCRSTAHAGQSASARTGDPPGSLPQTIARVRLAPRPLESVLATGSSSVT